MSAETAQNPIQGLIISLEQTSSSPPTITATVTNKNPFPVTFASYSSPLDDSALRLGIPRITPEGASEPITYPHIQLKRMWPPPGECIISIAAGGSEKKDITLSNPPVPLDDLQGKKVTVELKGRWMGVWAKAKEDVGKEDWEGARSYSGDYVSPSLEMTI